MITGRCDGCFKKQVDCRVDIFGLRKRHFNQTVRVGECDSGHHGRPRELPKRDGDGRCRDGPRSVNSEKLACLEEALGIEH